MTLVTWLHTVQHLAIPARVRNKIYLKIENVVRFGRNNNRMWFFRAVFPLSKFVLWRANNHYKNGNNNNGIIMLSCIIP